MSLARHGTDSKYECSLVEGLRGTMVGRLARHLRQPQKADRWTLLPGRCWERTGHRHRHRRRHAVCWDQPRAARQWSLARDVSYPLHVSGRQDRCLHWSAIAMAECKPRSAVVRRRTQQGSLPLGNPDGTSGRSQLFSRVHHQPDTKGPDRSAVGIN